MPFINWLGACMALLLFANTTAWAAKNAANTKFICGGKLESDVWQLWDDSGKEYIQSQQLTKRLKGQGDTYALYDVQTYTHNLVEMAQRCKRMDRLQELSEVFGAAFASLEIVPDSKVGMAWVCKGGAVCNDKNKLINKEVMLTSLQFLALTSSVANGLAQTPKEIQGKFVESIATVDIHHLQRWGDADALRQLDKQIAAQAKDVRDGSSALFLTDKQLWMIAVYADLAGILQNSPPQLTNAILTEYQLKAMRLHLSKLLKLFAERTTEVEGVGRDARKVNFADLDRGFWRLYADNKYAGYSGGKKPVSCIKQADGTFKINMLLDAGVLKPVDSIGWDISHARRLVHTFDAINRNRRSLQQVFGVSASDLPSEKTMRAFAQQLIVNVWNGDTEFPLFANYWNGVNGWYRVAYDNGTLRCMEGYPPFGLTDSFATGGYASWAHYVPEIGILGRRLYWLSMSDAEADHLFIDRYYSGMGSKASVSKKMLTQLMFWPSLVEAGQ